MTSVDDDGRPGTEFASQIRDEMDLNRDNWNARVPVHTAPDGYASFRALAEHPDMVTTIVEADMPLLGDLAGLDAVHLQCHIGTDTVSLARLGAQVTGLDFSADAIDSARDLAARCDLDIRFVVSDVYDAVSALDATYDLVYTGTGAINWLPDIGRWAEVVAGLLRPGAVMHIADGHPMMCALADEATPECIQLGHPYFEGNPASHWFAEQSYEGTGTVASPEMAEWGHDIGAIIQSLIDAGLVIEHYGEHRAMAWPQLPWMEPVPDRPGWWQLPEALREHLPVWFTLRARKPLAAG